MLRIIIFTGPILVGAMERVRIPAPINAIASSGRPAISPQSDTSPLASLALRTICLMMVSDAGLISTWNPTCGAVFNPKTMECFSSQGDGTLTVIKEKSPTEFSVDQTVKTMPSAKTLTLDSKSGKVLLIAAEYGAPPAGGRRGQLVPGSFSILVVGK